MIRSSQRIWPLHGKTQINAVCLIKQDATQGLVEDGDPEGKAPIIVTPQDASQATTRGEAVNDFVRSPQVWPCSGTGF